MNENLLDKVKTALSISGTFHDELLKIYIDDVCDMMRSAGVSDAVMNSEKILGCVARGVSDLWNFGQGNTTLSPYFFQRVAQLSREVESDVSAGGDGTDDDGVDDSETGNDV